ncbi:MAG: hypothetical protein BRC29_03805 [Nanohaloarchaea archaeon SW_7_43_1]|nr:MAG: hypothetical protein BRC29_03805 [Nanohaloarchaea archaeon SW_7_43_1]
MTNDGDGVHRQPITRRDVLKGLGAGGAVGLAGCSEILGDDSDSNSTPEPTSTPEPIAKTSIQEEALEHGEEYYAVTGSGKDARPHVVEHMEDFLDDENYSEQFKDTQLEYWLDLPGNLDDPNRTVNENGEIDWKALGRDIKHYVLRKKLLGADDWTKTGQPHIFADGTEGKGHHYNHTEEPNWDPDAFMPRWYNEKGKVFDISESGDTPSEWEYLGPDPDQGDRVGKLGENPEYAEQENQANFSIANQLEGPEPEDLVGEPITVCRVDWTAQGPEDYSPEPTPETLEIAEDVLKDIGIQSYMFKGKELEYNEVETRTGLEPAWEQHVPRKLKGPMEYAIYNHGLGGAWGDTEAALGIIGAKGSQESLAGILLHECYGHPFLGGHADQKEETLMTPVVKPEPVLQYTDGGEEALRRGIDIRSPSRRGIDSMHTKALPGFYSGPMAAYKDYEYYDIVNNYH